MGKMFQYNVCNSLILKKSKNKQINCIIFNQKEQDPRRMVFFLNFINDLIINASTQTKAIN